MSLKIPDEDVEFRIAKLQMKPGDALVIAVDRVISTESASRLRAHVERIVPNVRVLVLDKGCGLTLVSKAEADAIEATPNAPPDRRAAQQGKR